MPNEIPSDFFLTLKMCYVFLRRKKKSKPAGGFKHFFMFTPNPGEDEPILSNIFQMGWFNHQPENVSQFPVFRTLGSVVIDPVPIPSLKFVVGIALPRPSTSFHDYGRAEEVEKTSDWSVWLKNFRITTPGSEPGPKKQV